MFLIIGLLFFGLFFASLILPWIHLKRIQSLRQQVNRLTAQVAWLISHAREKGVEIPEQWETLSRPSENSVVEKQVPGQLPDIFFKDKKSQPPKAKSAVADTSLKKTAPFKDTAINFEQKYVVSLPVWIGGIALALSGAFLVKYSIEMGFLSPTVRLAIAGFFGVALILLGNWIHNKPHIANGKRISQALAGAGIADLYVCLFAATSFYHLIPPLFGFVGMGGVTALAVVLSLRQGPPIAMLGMIGGFLTPALIESREPNAPLLFIYLYFLLAGLFKIISKKNWWFIAIPVVLAAFAWVLFWVEISFSPHDGLWLGLFLIAVSGTIVFYSKKAMEESASTSSKTSFLFPSLNYLSLGGAILLMSVVAAKSNFGGMEWGLFGCLVAGGMVLSYYNQKLYGFIPWVSLAMALTLLLGWRESDTTQLAVTLFAFALLFTIGGYWLMWQARNPRSRALLAALSSLLYYVLAYAKFHNLLERVLITADWYTKDHFWGGIALGLFALSVCAVTHVLNRFQGEDDIKQRLLTVYTLTATAFLSIGLSLELSREFLTIALATEVLAISWINGHVHIKALRFIAGLLACFFALLIIPQILFQVFLLSSNFVAIESAIHSDLPNNVLPPYWESRIPSINWSLFHLGLPSLMFGMASVWLRQQKDDFLIKAFEMTAVTLITVMTYYLTRHAFHMNENLAFAESSFIERGVLTNIFFLYGLACLWIGRLFNREAVVLSGLSLIGLSLLRILFFDLLLYNPLWSHQNVGNFPIFNGLLLPFGLPILWLLLSNNALIDNKREKYFIYTNIILFLMYFFFVTFNVRQIYHGQHLDSGITSNAEVYTYSVAWLLIGIGLLFFGTLKQSKALRVASLSFMVLTIGKVFLYDAAELTGLLRVFSFLGLGVSLLGLSWFYTRFVFKAKP